MVTDVTSAYTHTLACVCVSSSIKHHCPGYVKQETMLGYHYQPIV